jgi:hypothetical protein
MWQKIGRTGKAAVPGRTAEIGVFMELCVNGGATLNGTGIAKDGSVSLMGLVLFEPEAEV